MRTFAVRWSALLGTPPDPPTRGRFLCPALAGGGSGNAAAEGVALGLEAKRGRARGQPAHRKVRSRNRWLATLQGRPGLAVTGCCNLLSVSGCSDRSRRRYVFVPVFGLTQGF